MPKDNPGWWSRNVNRVAHPEEQSPEQAKRAPWILLAFVALVVIVAVGVWALRVFWFEPSQTAEPTPQPSSSSAPVQTPTPTDPDGTCTLDNTDRDISTTPPEATQWVIERWAPLPVVDGAGPCIERDGYRVGFAHTQTGALLATYHYVVHGNIDAPGKGTRALLDYALLDGPLKDETLQHVEAVENGSKVRTPDSDLAKIQFMGYRIVAFDGDSAVVELRAGVPQSAPGSLTVKLVWKDGDWRIDPASGSDWVSSDRNVAAQGFVPWSSLSDGQ